MYKSKFVKLNDLGISDYYY